MSFLPTEIPGLVLWLKADTGTFQDTGLTTPAVVDADPVGGWQDQSGSSNHALQSTAGLRPLLKLGIQGGLPALLFDGSDDALNVTGLNQAQPTTWFVVGRSIDGADNRHLIDGVTTDQTIGFNAGLAIYAGGSVLRYAPAPTTWILLSVIFNSTASSMALKSETVATGDAGTQAINSLRIGQESGGLTTLNGYIGEILLYNSALSNLNLRRVEYYLNARWFGGGYPSAPNILRPRPFAPGLAR